MKHGKTAVVALTLSFTLWAAGCAQKCCLPDFNDVTTHAGIPTDLETRYNAANDLPHKIKAPPTVDDPEREPWYITLHEAIAIALEQGTTGLQSIRLFGSPDDDLVVVGQLGGLSPFGDSIRVLALNPAIFGTNIELNLARYDVVARAIAGMRTQDQVTGTGAALGNGEYAIAGASLEKANAYGGLASITIGNTPTQGLNSNYAAFTSYQNANITTGTINPVYSTNLSLNYQQPLLWGFGPDINSLLTQHPESFIGGVQSLISTTATGGQSGIVISRILFDQERTDFERSVNFMLANVETAYWNLYGSFVNLYSSEQALRQAHAAWKVNKAKYEAGTQPITQYAQTLEQYEQFRGDRLVALGAVLENERILRALLGLRMEDGKRLVPVDKPTTAPYKPDWESAWQECMTLRPELINAQRTDLKQKQLELVRATNTLLPDLEFVVNYNIHGAGDTLDGDAVFGPNAAAPTIVNQSQNAARVFASGHFQDGGVGLTLAMPLGFRAQNAAVRAAKLRLTQSYYQLRDQENRAERYLRAQYEAVIQKYRELECRHHQREASADQLEARFKEFVAGKTTVDFLLQNQKDWAAALNSEYQAVVDYNNALVRFEFAKGTILQHNGISISEGALPQCAQVRAVDNEAKRAAAIVTHERANPVPHPLCDPDNQVSGMPQLPPVGAPSLPALMSGAGKAPDKVDDPNAPAAVVPNWLPTMPANKVSTAPSTPAPVAAVDATPALPQVIHEVPLNPVYAKVIPATPLATMPTTPGPLPTLNDSLDQAGPALTGTKNGQ